MLHHIPYYRAFYSFIQKKINNIHMLTKLYQIFNIVSLSIKNKLISVGNVLKRVFTKTNLIKVSLIFIVGLISRAIVNHYYQINVYSDFLHSISIIYYFFMSIFIVLVHEFIVCTNFNIIPPYITNLFVSIFNTLKPKEFYINLFKTVMYNSKLLFSSFKVEYLKISYITKIIRNFSFNGFNDKMLLGPATDKYESYSVRNSKDSTLKAYVLNKNGDSSSKQDSNSSRHSGSSRQGSSNRYSSSSRSSRHPTTVGGNRDNSNGISNNTQRPHSTTRLPSSIPMVIERETIYNFTSPGNQNPGYEILLPYTYAPVNSNYSTKPSMPKAPCPSNLSSPTLSPLSTTFPNLNNPPLPDINIHTPSVSSNYREVSYQATDNREYALDSEGRYLPVNSRQISSITDNSTSNNGNSTGHPYPVPGYAPYFNPTRVSTNTTKATIGLNGSNERL